jgi:hypothetical protein
MIHKKDNAFPDNKYSGLTKREYFAAMAMQAIITVSGRIDKDFNITAIDAVQSADSLIRELNKKR